MYIGESKDLTTTSGLYNPPFDGSDRFLYLDLFFSACSQGLLPLIFRYRLCRTGADGSNCSPQQHRCPQEKHDQSPGPPCSRQHDFRFLHSPESELWLSLIYSCTRPYAESTQRMTPWNTGHKPESEREAISALFSTCRFAPSHSCGPIPLLRSSICSLG